MKSRYRLISFLTLIALIFTSGFSGASASTARAYVNDCGAPEYKPESLTQFCTDVGTAVVKIKWTSWTSTRAVGTGSYFVNTCEPDCADGKLLWAKVKVVLSGAKFTRGKRYLMNVTVSSINGKPLPDASRTTTIGWVSDYWMD